MFELVEEEEEEEEEVAAEAPEEAPWGAPEGVGVRSMAVMEFLKWLFFVSGIVGFIGWLGNLLYGYPIMYGLYTPTIPGTYIPYATLAFGVVLVLGCVIAAKQRSNEINARAKGLEGRLDETTFNLSKVSAELSVATKKLSREMGRSRRLSQDLEQARSVLSQLRTQTRKLTSERNALEKDLKAAQEKLAHALAPSLSEIKGIGSKTAEKLRDMGIRDVIDLLSTSPEELATRTEISPKIIARWFEQAVTLREKAGI